MREREREREREKEIERVIIALIHVYYTQLHLFKLSFRQVFQKPIHSLILSRRQIFTKNLTLQTYTQKHSSCRDNLYAGQTAYSSGVYCIC